MTRPLLLDDPKRQRQPPGSLRGFVDPARPDLAFLRFACSPELRRRIVLRSHEEDVSMSEVIRRAIREYVGREYIR